MKLNIRVLYLYLFSFVGLLITVFGCIQIVNLGLKATVFKEADVYESYPMAVEPGKTVVESTEAAKIRQERETKRQRQRELSNAIAMVAVGIPLYLYHWKVIKKENKKNQA